MNRIILMGRLTRDPETRYSQSAEPVAVCRYGIAVNRGYKREGQPDADFFNCVAFGKNGEFVEKFLKKGMLIALEGSLRNNNWTDKDGQKRYDLEIVVDHHYFTESKAAFESRQSSYQNQGSMQNMPPQNSQSSQPQADFSPIVEDIDDDDLPF
ncbi:MAG: single-stranded DNA-binding protein [Defluviitaleaceae bacterium]|nr:single-stranded DNA-binding protein [Defluviitaleaceae bacterium]